jgi:hypothetical protein
MSKTEVVYAENAWVELTGKQRELLRSQLGAQADLAFAPAAHTAGLHHADAGYFSLVDSEGQYGFRQEYDVVHWDNPYARQASCSIGRSSSDHGWFLSAQNRNGVLATEGVLFRGGKSYFAHQEIVVDPEDESNRDVRWASMQFLAEGKRQPKEEIEPAILALGKLSVNGISGAALGRMVIGMNSYGVGVSAATATEVQPGKAGITSYKLADTLLSLVTAPDRWKPEDGMIEMRDGAGRQTGVSFGHKLGLIALSHAGHYPHIIALRVASPPLPDEPYSIVKQYAIMAQGVIVDYVSEPAERFGPAGIIHAINVMGGAGSVGSPIDAMEEPVLLGNEEMQALNELLISLVGEQIAAKRS